ncbi:35992_t:CDS:1, partial [Racocetra persica]
EKDLKNMLPILLIDIQDLNLYNDNIQPYDRPEMSNYIFNTLPSALVSNLSDNKLKLNNFDKNIFGLDDLEEIVKQGSLLFTASNTLENGNLLGLGFDLENNTLEFELDKQEFKLNERTSELDKQEFELETQKFELGGGNNN